MTNHYGKRITIAAAGLPFLEVAQLCVVEWRVDNADFCVLLLGVQEGGRDRAQGWAQNCLLDQLACACQAA